MSLGRDKHAAKAALRWALKNGFTEVRRAACKVILRAPDGEIVTVSDGTKKNAGFDRRSLSVLRKHGWGA